MKFNLGIAMLVLASVPAVSSADPPPQVDGERVVWDFGNEAKGTPAEISEHLNRSLEEAYTRCQDLKHDAKVKDAELKLACMAALKPMHEGTAYKTKLAQEKLAESDLEVARTNSDGRAALTAFNEINGDNADLAKMDAQVLDANQDIVQLKAAAQDCEKRYADSQTALKKIALWRARLAYWVKGGLCLRWPVSVGGGFFLMDAKVVAINSNSVTIELSVPERSPQWTVKNARGDGLDLIVNEFHTLRLIVPKPAEKVAAGHVWHISRAFVIARDSGATGGIPVFNAEPDDNGAIGILTREVDGVRGPSKEFLNEIDTQVAKEEQDAANRIAIQSAAGAKKATSRP